MKWSSIILTDDNEFVFSKAHTVDDIRKEFKLDANHSINQHFGEFLAIFNTLSELLSINKGLKKAGKPIKRITIHTDSENSFLGIYGLRKFNAKLTGLNKINSFCKMLKNQCSQAGIELEICWVPGHSQIYGNEVANRWTKSHTKNRNEFANCFKLV
jgi:ribonuclease HI